MMNNYNIRYKALDRVESEEVTKIRAFLTPKGWVAETTEPDSLEFISGQKQQYRTILTIYLIKKELEADKVEWTDLGHGDSSMSFIESQFIPDVEMLTFFDKLGYNLSERHTAKTGQEIEDWYDVQN